MSAELAARRTAAAAVLADYRRWVDGDIISGDWQSWSLRLALAVGSLVELARGMAPGQLAVLGQVLADAIAYRDPSGACPLCDRHPAGLCEDHAADMDRTDAYLALARELGIEVDR